jgi:hypothetical protein
MMRNEGLSQRSLSGWLTAGDRVCTIILNAVESGRASSSRLEDQVANGFDLLAAGVAEPGHEALPA